MTRPNAGPASADGQNPRPASAGEIDPNFEEPSTRRVTLGSPPVASPDGEPYFSQAVDPADPVFAVIKDRISRLWDAGASAADIQGVLDEVHNRQD